MKSGSDQMGGMRSSGSGSMMNSPHGSSDSSNHSRSDSASDSRNSESERSGMQHTNAGNTGTGSGQISPVTQHPHDSASRNAQRGTSGIDRDREK